MFGLLWQAPHRELVLAELACLPGRVAGFCCPSCSLAVKQELCLSGSCLAALPGGASCSRQGRASGCGSPS